MPIRVGLNDINAYYDGTQVQIGKNQAGAWISSMDVVAHEFGHGVDDKTPGGISGGGTQEFIGDALAAATEYYDGQSAPYDSPDDTNSTSARDQSKPALRTAVDTGTTSKPISRTIATCRISPHSIPA